MKSKQSDKTDTRLQVELDEVLRSSDRLFSVTEEQVEALQLHGFDIEMPESLKNPMEVFERVCIKKSYLTPTFNEDPTIYVHNMAARKGKEISPETLNKMKNDRGKNNKRP